MIHNLEFSIEKASLDIEAYRIRLAHATTEEERLMYKVFVRMCEEPAQTILGTLNETNSIQEFRYTFLSNFYATPIAYAGREYASVENAYQAQKFPSEALAKASDDTVCMSEIREALSLRGRLLSNKDISGIFAEPALASGQGKIIADILREHSYVRSDWDNDKMLLMMTLLRQKFVSGGLLAARLLATNEMYLVEGNTWGDTLWGVSDSRGRNMLGMMLMQIRASLRESDELKLDP